MHAGIDNSEAHTQIASLRDCRLGDTGNPLVAAHGVIYSGGILRNGNAFDAGGDRLMDDDVL